MASRIAQIANHVSSNEEDIVIVYAKRTPITRAKKGAFKDTNPEYLLAAVFKDLLATTKIDPALVDDIQVGNVLPNAGGATVARMAQLYAGFPNTSSISTVNRQCSSGLQAIHYIAACIQNGTIDIGIGAGVESMTMGYGAGAMPPSVSEDINANKEAADCLLPMGITSENVAREFNISREKQDKFAAFSHHRATLAWKNGHFASEIVPVTTKVIDKDGKEVVVTVTRDDGIRPETTPESLAKLKPAFSASGYTTAGNASQVSDGAAAVLLMKRKTAKQLHLPVIGRFVAFATAGVPPNVMGIGPAYAIPKVLAKTGLSKSQVDLWEINEAFASQAVFCVEKLGLDVTRVNPNGGAIAFGHPLGCTGARQIATLLPELKRQGKKVGVTSMCIGTGMGAACVIFAEY